MSASPNDDESRKDLVARVTAMGEKETEDFLWRGDCSAFEMMIGCLVHRWGMQKTVALLHDELADLEVHG